MEKNRGRVALPLQRRELGGQVPQRLPVMLAAFGEDPAPAGERIVGGRQDGLLPGGPLDEGPAAGDRLLLVDVEREFPVGLGHLEWVVGAITHQEGDLAARPDDQAGAIYLDHAPSFPVKIIPGIHVRGSSEISERWRRVWALKDPA